MFCSTGRASLRGLWLAVHAEPGQTFAAYVRSHSVSLVGRYSTLYLQPIGEFGETQRQIFELTAELLGVFYGVPVRALPALSLDILPPSARRVHPTWGDQQILTRYVLDRVLVPNRPDDALAFLALTALDLWPGAGWNFVFGEALVGERVGVWSIHRYGDPQASAEARQLCLRRTLKVAVHETGHMLDLRHCIEYECGMNGSNHLQEMDARPVPFCPECAPKVWWACRVDPEAWFSGLAEFARRNALAEEAAFWAKSAERAS